MRKRGRIKYFLIICICCSIFIYGFIEVNINKSELVRKKSRFTMNLKLNPVDFRIETKSCVFYVNSKVIYDMKEKCVNAYNDIFTK